MECSYEDAKNEFRAELKAGEFSIELHRNSGPNRMDKEEGDLTAFKTYLASDDYKTFNKEVAKK